MGMVKDHLMLYFYLYNDDLFGLLYSIFGIEIDDKYVIYNLSNLKNTDFIKFIDDFNKSLTLSTGIFLGVGWI